MQNSKAPNMTRAALWVLAIGLLARLFIAIWLPLGTDEAYAIAVAREFSWSFFDHPPIGFWLPVVMAKLTGIEAPVLYRLPFLLCGLVTALAIWRIGHILGGARTAFYSLLLFTAAPYMLISSSLFVVPDGPLNMFLALTTLALIRALNTNEMLHWCATGLWLALAMACKYQAGLFPISVLAFLIFTASQRPKLSTPGPWVAACIGLLGLAPVLLWNIQNDWISFAFHTGRVGPTFQPANFAAMTIGQAIYLIPTTLVFATIALVQATKQRTTPPETRLLAWIAVAPIAMFTLTYIYGTSTFPHWTMPGWLFALPLAGHWFAQRTGPWPRRLFIGFAVPIWALLIVLILHIPTGFLTRNAPVLPNWDNTTEIFDYRTLDAQARAAGWLTDDSLIVALDWIQAGHLSTGLRGAYPMRVLGDSPHHFQFMRGSTMTQNAVLLVSGRSESLRKKRTAAASIAAKRGATLTPLGDITLNRADRPYMIVTAFRVTWP